jgi:hypothetical protein
MTLRKTTIATLFITVCLSGCTHYYYVANVQNVPLFKEKNEIRLSGEYGFGDYSECAEVQAAYSLNKNLGIMTNFMSAKGGSVSGKDYGKGYYFDGAIGYFKTINNHGVFEIYGGLGGSSQHHQYSGTNFNQGSFSREYYGSSDLSFIKLFIQPSFGLTFNIFDIALSTRICSLSFNNTDNDITGNSNLYNDLNSTANRSYLFLEPAFTIRGGWKYLKVQFQVAVANVFDKPDLFFVEQPHISVGLYTSIATRYK